MEQSLLGLVVLLFLSGQAAATGMMRPASSSIPKSLIEDLQEDLALKPFQAAAVVGNLAQETGNFTTLHEKGGSGLGYSQWTGARKSRFERFSRGEIMSYRANYGFLRHELTTEYLDVLVALKKTKTTEEATRTFMALYLKPNPKHAALGKRIDFAGDYLSGDFGGAGCHLNPAPGQQRIATCR